MTFEEWWKQQYSKYGDNLFEVDIKDFAKEAWGAAKKDSHKWGPYSKGAKRGYCNKGGCKDSFWVGGNYGGEVCYNPDHKDKK